VSFDAGGPVRPQRWFDGVRDQGSRSGTRAAIQGDSAGRRTAAAGNHCAAAKRLSTGDRAAKP
jgi:hypothetical protein